MKNIKPKKSEFLYKNNLVLSFRKNMKWALVYWHGHNIDKIHYSSKLKRIQQIWRSKKNSGLAMHLFNQKGYLCDIVGKEIKN